MLTQKPIKSKNYLQSQLENVSFYFDFYYILSEKD